MTVEAPSQSSKLVEGGFTKLVEGGFTRVTRMAASESLNEDGVNN